MGLRTSDFDYDLPAGRIAQRPAPRRDDARLLVLPRVEGPLRHERVRDLARHLRAGDLLVANDVRVERARLFGRKPTGGRVEALLIEPAGPATATEETWVALLRASRTPSAGSRIEFPEEITAEVLGREPAGAFRIRLQAADELAVRRARAGSLPLPPYIERPEGPQPEDEDRYQTVYAARPGAVAAPTAGLHFTPELLAEIEDLGIRRASVTLRVGPGTFRPVTEDDPARHEMHEEAFEVPEETALAYERTRCAGGRIVAVGTTTVRVLESVVEAGGDRLRAGAGRTRLYLLPGCAFRAVDALMTNFHLPRSTLLMLVCAFAGTERTLAAYREAVEKSYRFYSYGDAMLIA